MPPTDEYSYAPPNFKVVFLGTNRLPHCDYTLAHYVNLGYSIDSSGVFTGIVDNLDESPFPIYVGATLVILNKYYIVSSINENFSSQIVLTPANPNDVLDQGSGSYYYLYNGCGINENYYTNESLKFGLLITSAGSSTGYRVLGTPKLAINFSGQNGTIRRYAEFKEEFSSYSDSLGSDAYFEFQYVIQGVDNGVPNIVSLPLDGDNLIQVKFSYGADTFYSSLFWNATQYQSDHTDMTRVRVNWDGEPSGRNNNQFTILLKRSDVPGKTPSSSDIILGEPAINTADGKFFIKKEDDSIVSITPIEPQIFTTKNIDITASQNDLDLESSSTVRLNPTVEGANISGFVAGNPGEIKLIYNAGTQSLNILHNSNDSAEGNRVLISGNDNFSLDVNSGVTILYDGLSAAWRLF